MKGLRVPPYRYRRKGHATYRLVRYADDFVVMVAGTKAHAEAVRQQAAAVLAPMGLHLSEAKTRITHIDEGFDFLGFRIQRQPHRSTGKPTVYTYPSKAAVAAIKRKVRQLTQGGTNQSLQVLLHQINPVLRGWANYYRHGVSKATYDYVRHYTWRRLVIWLRKKHRRRNWKWLRRRYLPGWWPTDGKVILYDIGKVPVTRYRYRGTRIPTPWDSDPTGTTK